MKTPEDEAFDEIERRQGGGFPAKRAMAADKLHWSDCAVHNAPAYLAGACDCGVEKGQEDWGALAEKQLASIKRDTQASLEDAMVRATHKVMAEFEAQPVQEPEREALKLALSTLEGWDNHGKWVWPETALEQAKRNTKEAITAIKAALSQPPLPVQPVQEPVAFICQGNLYMAEDVDKYCTATHISLYTAPPKRPWVGLTDEEIGTAYVAWDATGGASFVDFARIVEQLLKDKNT